MFSCHPFELSVHSCDLWEFWWRREQGCFARTHSVNLCTSTGRNGGLFLSCKRRFVLSFAQINTAVVNTELWALQEGILVAPVLLSWMRELWGLAPVWGLKSNVLRGCVHPSVALLPAWNSAAEMGHCRVPCTTPECCRVSCSKRCHA